MILLVTGNGKGKTTAALGQAMRFVGDGKKVLMVQFIKSPSWVTGESIAAKRLEPEFKMVQMGKGFVGILGDTLPREEHAKAAKNGLAWAEKEFTEGKWDVLVLDEVNVALHLKLVPVEAVKTFLERFPKDKDCILTGRWAPEELFEYADYVTEMKDTKHPFEKGHIGKRGIEF